MYRTENRWSPLHQLMYHVMRDHRQTVASRIDQIPQKTGIWCYHIEAETNGRHFPDDISKCIFLNETVWISIKISLKFVPNGLFDNIPALGQIMACCWPGDKPLSEPMMESLPTHMCVTRPQWVKWTAHVFLPRFPLWGTWQRKWHKGTISI